MKKQIVIIGIIALLLSVGFTGCNQISNLFLGDREKLIGAWNTDGIWTEVPTVVEFASNGTFKMTLFIGLTDFSINKGKWEMNNGILTLEIVDVIPKTNYTYQYSDNGQTCTITDTDDITDTYILRKQ
jgi:hypothetical protein